MQVLCSGPLFHPGIPVESVGDVGASQNLKLICCNYSWSIPTDTITVSNVSKCHRQTDGQTIYSDITTLCIASCGNDYKNRAMRTTYGCPDNFRVSLTTPRLPFPKFLTGFCSDEPINVPTKLEVCSCTRSRDNFTSIFTPFRDNATNVLQHATFPHPTSSLLKISPCSPGWPLGYEERSCWANCPCN